MPREQRPQFLLKRQLAMVLGAVDEMDQVLTQDQGLWHRVRAPGCDAPSGLAEFDGPLTQGGASRLHRCALPWAIM